MASAGSVMVSPVLQSVSFSTINAQLAAANATVSVGTQGLTAGYVGAGTTTLASAGTVRLMGASSIKSRGAGAYDINVASADGADNMTIGDVANMLTLNLRAISTFDMRTQIHSIRNYDGTVRATVTMSSADVTHNIASGATWAFQSNGTTRIKIDGTGIGFFAASPAAKQTVTGSKGANAALTSLCTALATLGLITDSTS